MRQRRSVGGSGGSSEYVDDSHPWAVPRGLRYLGVCSKRTEVGKRGLHFPVPNLDSLRPRGGQPGDRSGPRILSLLEGKILRFQMQPLVRLSPEADWTKAAERLGQEGMALFVGHRLSVPQIASSGCHRRVFAKLAPSGTSAPGATGRGNWKAFVGSCRCSLAGWAPAASLGAVWGRWERPERRILGPAGSRGTEGVERRWCCCGTGCGRETWGGERTWMAMRFGCRSAGWRCWPASVDRA